MRIHTAHTHKPAPKPGKPLLEDSQKLMSNYVHHMAETPVAAPFKKFT